MQKSIWFSRVMNLRAKLSTVYKRPVDYGKINPFENYHQPFSTSKRISRQNVVEWISNLRNILRPYLMDWPLSRYLTPVTNALCVWILHLLGGKLSQMHRKRMVRKSQLKQQAPPCGRQRCFSPAHWCSFGFTEKWSVLSNLEVASFLTCVQLKTGAARYDLENCRTAFSFDPKAIPIWSYWLLLNTGNITVEQLCHINTQQAHDVDTKNIVKQ